MVAVYEKSTASTIPGPRAGLPRRCLKGLGRCFKLIPTCEGREPEPASEGATAVVRNATQNLQEVQVLQCDSGGGVLKNLWQSHELSGLKKIGRTNAKFNIRKAC